MIKARYGHVNYEELLWSRHGPLKVPEPDMFEGQEIQNRRPGCALKLVVKAEEYGLEIDEKLINGAFKFEDNQSVMPLYLLINSLDSNDEAVEET